MYASTWSIASFMVGVPIFITAIAYRLLARHQKKSMRELSPLHILIVGASSGVGEHLAYEYASSTAAHHLILASRRTDRLSIVKQNCIQLGAASVNIIQTDVSIDSDLKALANFVNTEFNGILHIFVYSVGALNICPFDAIISCSDTEATHLVNQMFRINVTALILLTRLLLPYLRFANTLTFSRIVIVSSIAGLISAPSRALYCSAKAAIHGFFNALRIEEHRACPTSPVQIQLICPGTIAGTELRKAALDAFLWSDKFPSGSSSSTLTASTLAKSIVQNQDQDLLVLPYFYNLAILVRLFFPNWIDYLARRKYK